MLSKYIRLFFYVGIPLVFIILSFWPRVFGGQLNLKLDSIKRITVAFGSTGQTAEIDSEDIVKIVNSINNFTYYKIDRTRYAGWEYNLKIIDNKGNVSNVGIVGEDGLSIKNRYFSRNPHGLIEIVEKYR